MHKDLILFIKVITSICTLEEFNISNSDNKLKPIKTESGSTQQHVVKSHDVLIYTLIIPSHKH